MLHYCIIERTSSLGSLLVKLLAAYLPTVVEDTFFQILVLQAAATRFDSLIREKERLVSAKL